MDITRISDLLDLYASHYRKPDVFAVRPDARWVCSSSADLVRFSNDISRGLLALDLCKGDRVGIMSGNRPEWNYIDFGAAQIGVVTVPLYPTMSGHDLAYILRDAEIKVLFIEGPALYEKIRTLETSFSDTLLLFSLEPVAGLRSWNALRETDPAGSNAVETARSAVQPDDLLTLIYTSGTTGNPK